MNKRFSRILLFLVLLPIAHVDGQSTSIAGGVVEDLRQFTENPAVPGYENQLATVIAAKLKSFSSRIDAQNNVYITLGSGSPRRMLVTGIDEPGFVASGVTPDGYLTVQRLPQAGNLPLFNELYAAQPVKIETHQGSWIDGAVAGISVHLLPQRQHPPSPADLDNVFVDAGATNAAQVKAGGADVLSPIAIDRRFYEMGYGRWTAPAIGDRFGAAVLVDVLRHLDTSKLQGTVMFAFVTQQWVGARGLQRLVYEFKPDELIYVGRRMRAGAVPGQREAAPSFKRVPGDGVLLLSEDTEALSSFAAELKELAGKNNIKTNSDYSSALLPGGSYMLQPKLPDRTVHLAVATAWPSTPAEVLQATDVTSLVSLLDLYLGAPSQNTEPHQQRALAEPAVPVRSHSQPPVADVLRKLIETYAVSEHEGNMRASVTNLLPPWAKPMTDDGGNLVLHISSSSSGHAQKIAIVAHMDEIGYEVRSILPDGRLELKDEGGSVQAYFLGHAALVHSSNGIHPGVLELPDGWEAPDFQWPRARGQVFHMDVGATSADQVAQLGIKQGDFVTIPKKYRTLMGTRVSGRSLDDRVGCAALVAATWALGQSPQLGNRDVTFIWSTREELGLEGAAVAAKDMAVQGPRPDYVFAIDTFVSADSPLESKRFADATLGRGFVVRAVDNSNIVPRKLTEKVVSIARANNISAQYGVTGGGNDGATFLLYGTTDIAIGWPLRYSHSPAEVIDVRDVEALAKIIAAVARSW